MTVEEYIEYKADTNGEIQQSIQEKRIEAYKLIDDMYFGMCNVIDEYSSEEIGIVYDNIDRLYELLDDYFERERRAKK